MPKSISPLRVYFLGAAGITAVLSLAALFHLADGSDVLLASLLVVTLTAWQGGAVPGWVASGFGLAGRELLQLQAGHSPLAVSSVGQALLFVAACGCICAACEQLRHTQREAHTHLHRLQESERASAALLSREQAALDDVGAGRAAALAQAEKLQLANEELQSQREELQQIEEELRIQQEELQQAYNELRQQQQRLTFMLEASMLLASSLDYEAILGRVARLAVPRLADWCAIDLEETEGEAGAMRQVAIAHADPVKEQLAGKLRRLYPPDGSAPFGPSRVIRTAQPELVSRISESFLVSVARNHEHLEQLRELGFSSSLVVPLLIRGRAVGTITLAQTGGGRSLEPEDLSLAEDLARRCALAVEHARLYHEAQDSARTREAALQLQEDLDRRLTLLVEASQTLLGSPRLSDVLPAILDVSRQLISADAYAVWRFHPQSREWRIVASNGLSAEYQLQTIATSDPVPVMPSHSLVIEDVRVTELVADRRAGYLAEGIRSILVVPLRIQGEESGTITFYYRQPHSFTPTEVRVGTALSNLAASAVSIAELYEAQSRMRQQAELAQQRLAFIAEASSVLAASLDYELTLQSLTRVVIPHLADWCAAHVLRESLPSFTGDSGIEGAATAPQVRQLAVAHSDPDKVRWALELEGKYPYDANAPQGLPNVLRTGKSEIYPVIDDALLAASIQDPEQLELMRHVGLTSAMIVPLLVGGKPVGAISLYYAESGRHYTADDLALAEDLARRAATAIENARLYDEVQGAGRRKDEFLAMLAHELRNPLGAIRNALHILRNTQAPIDSRNRALAVVDRQVNHQVRMVDDLLDVSRITRGKITLRQEPVDLSRVVQEAAEDARSILAAANLTPRLECPTDPVWIQGDATRLSQTLGNLLQNAAKFSDNGGEVLVRLSVDAESRTAEILVRDFGIGIRPDVLPYIFEPFTQADQTLARSRGGLGLGLALVKGLVELHGGSVVARSEGSGLGAEFILRLPLEPGARL